MLSSYITTLKLNTGGAVQLDKSSHTALMFVKLEPSFRQRSRTGFLVFCIAPSLVSSEAVATTSSCSTGNTENPVDSHKFLSTFVIT